jgi:hypothetical protein
MEGSVAAFVERVSEWKERGGGSSVKEGFFRSEGMN